MTKDKRQQGSPSLRIGRSYEAEDRVNSVESIVLRHCDVRKDSKAVIRPETPW